MGKGKFIFMLIWLPVTVLVGYLLFFGDKLERNGAAIGVVSTVHGDVQLRPNADVVWRRVRKGQELYLLDNIATGEHSSASLKIKGMDGDILLADNTQIKLVIPKNKKDDFEIGLVAGDASVKVRANALQAPGKKPGEAAKAGLVINTGSQRYALKGAGESLTLHKDAASDHAEVTEAKGPIVVHEVVAAAAPQTGAAPPPKKEKSYVLEQKKATTVNPMLAVTERNIQQERIQEARLAQAEKEANAKKSFMERSLATLRQGLTPVQASGTGPAEAREEAITFNKSSGTDAGTKRVAQRPAAAGSVGKLDDSAMELEKVDLAKLGIAELPTAQPAVPAPPSPSLKQGHMSGLTSAVGPAAVHRKVDEFAGLFEKPQVIGRSEEEIADEKHKARDAEEKLAKERDKLKKQEDQHKKEGEKAKKEEDKAKQEKIEAQKKKEQELAKKKEVPPPPPPEFRPEEVVPVLVAPPPPGTVFFTDKPMSEALNFPLAMEIAPPKAAKFPEYWRPLIAGANMNPQHAGQPEIILAEGTSDHHNQKLTVTLASLVNSEYVQLVKNPDRVYHVMFVMGAKVGTSPEDARALYNDRYEYRFQSIAEFNEAVPMAVYFSDPDGEGSRRGKGWRPSLNKTSQDLYKLTLTTGRDLRFVYGLLAPAAELAFRVEPRLAQKEVAIYLAREHNIIAQLNDAPSERLLLQLKKALRADVVYHGKRDAYIGDLDTFKSLLEENKIPKVFYVLHNDKYIEINLEFMRSHPSIGRFLEENASAFFREPVEMVKKDPVPSH